MGFYKDKVCQHCGSDYSGTASSKYCLICKVDIMEQRLKESNVKYRERKRDESLRSN